MGESISRISEKAEASFSIARLRGLRVYPVLMKRALTVFLSAMALLTVSPLGKASPTPSQSPPPPGAAYGAYPHNYQELITNWLNEALVDPRSVQVKWLSEPRPGDLKVSKTQVVSGFLVDFSVNARNVFGASTGFQKHTALIRDGQVVTATGFMAR
jgi:hypothetical protein